MKKSYLAATLFLGLSMPVFASAAPLELSWSKSWTYDHNTSQSATDGAEIVARDSSNRLWVIGENGIDILNGDGQLTMTIDTSGYGAANSIAIQGDNIAVAFAASTVTDPGQVVLFNPSGQGVKTISVGANPDMVTFTSDGKILVANEGEPDAGVNPEGSISIISSDFNTVETASFSNYNGQETSLRQTGVRIFPGESAAQDFEPEYIAVSGDGKKAYVTLQENNSIAIVDIDSKQVEEVVALGTKDHTLATNGLDSSDKDGIDGNIKTAPVKGMYMPDAINSYQANGKTYLVTANEGDARDEDERIKELVLDPTIFPNAAELQKDEEIGRLQISTIDGDTDADGDFDELYSYGTRSFSIWDEDGQLVWDSGDFIEQFLIDNYPELWQDKRSDNKGPEPEGLALLEVFDSTIAFIGLERVSGILSFDITDPNNPYFLNFLFNTTDGKDGDVGPEGLLAYEYDNKFWLAVANETSKTTTLYDLDIKPVPEPATMLLFGAGLAGLFGVVRAKSRRK